MTTNLLNQFGEVRPELESKCYFDLGHKAKKIVNQLDTRKSNLSIEAWSFVPHQDVLSLFEGADLQRHIVTIDTQSSNVYFPVLAFLERERPNVASFYSGGWADFVCDVRLGSQSFQLWLEELREVLRSANAQQFSPDRGVDALITVFQVMRSHVLCHKILAGLGRPSPEIMDEISADPMRFEMTYRNYRSPETLGLFNNDEKALRRYLRRLKKENAILCFRIVTDISRNYARDYVAFRIENRIVDGLIRAAHAKNDLFKPVEDFLQVRVIQSADESEQDITHIFLNSYGSPGQRRDWKFLMYQWAHPSASAGADVNLYNYPLEGTVNESPTYISDYPEFLTRAQAYQFETSRKAILIGEGKHSTPRVSRPKVYIPADGIVHHGVILGMPGSGKTNTELVFSVNALSSVKNVLILDGNLGVWSKLEAVSQFLEAKRITIPAVDLKQEIIDMFEEVGTSKGITVVEFAKESYGAILDSVMDRIGSREDVVKGNLPRAIPNILILDESADALLGEPARADRLVRFLDKSGRKGWCVWLSTQRPSGLGPDQNRSRLLLETMKNWIVHPGLEPADAAMLLEVLDRTKHSENDVDYVRRQIGTRQQGTAMVRAVARNSESLPPIFVNVPLLQDSLK